MPETAEMRLSKHASTYSCLEARWRYRSAEPSRDALEPGGDSNPGCGLDPVAWTRSERRTRLLEPAAYASELSAICQSSSAVRSRRVANAPITVRDWIAQPPEWIEIVHGDAVDAVSGDLDIGELTSC